MDTRGIMTLAEVAAYLRVHPNTIHRLLRRRKGPAGFKIGHDWRFSREAIEAWCRRIDQPGTRGPSAHAVQEAALNGCDVGFSLRPPQAKAR